MLAAKRSLRLLSLLALLGAALLSSGVPAAGQGVAGVREVLHIDSASSGTQKTFEAFDTANLNLYDVDGDGLPELITQNDNNRLYVLDPRTGRVLSELTTYFSGPNSSDPSQDRGGDTWGARVLGGVAVGDLDRNGRIDLVVTNSAAYLTRFEFVPDESAPDRFTFVEKWHLYVDAREFEPDTCDRQRWIENCTTAYPGMDGNPALGDVDGDGTLEIFVSTDDFPGHFSFTASGELRWMTTWFDGNAGPLVTDLDGDGTNEAVFVTDGGAVVAYNGRTGTPRWTFQASKNGAWPGSISVSATVADVRGDGQKLIVVGARNVSRDHASDPEWPQKSHAVYFAIDRTGKVVWKQSFEWGNPHVYMHPAAVDVSGDGILDFLFMDWNTVGHKPGNWETTGRSTNLFALNGIDGSPIWQSTSSVFWSNKDLVVADVDGDGTAEAVVADATGGDDALALHDLRTGALQGYVPLSGGWRLSRGPVAADLHNDGRLFLVVPVMKDGASGCTHPLDVGCREGALKILETGGRIGNALWTNNVLFNAALDGHTPGNAAPSPPDTNGTPGNATNDTSDPKRDPSPKREPQQPVPEEPRNGIPAPAAAATAATLALLARALRERRRR